MLATLDPAPTGMITALLGRARISASDITAAIGPSPRQMRELTEGRGLFSPYKLKRVADLTRVPEEAIREALCRVPEMIEAAGISEGDRVDHPRLGPCEVVKGGKHLTIRTGKGDLIEGVHPLSLVGPDLLDRFGLRPEPEEAKEAGHEVDTEAAKDTPEKRSDEGENLMKPGVEETLIATEEPAKKPDFRTGQETNTPIAPDPEARPASKDTDPREVVRDLVDRSGKSQAALSRALGKDPSFLNAILKRGRRVPEGLIDRLTLLCEPDPVAEPEAPEPERTAPPETSDSPLSETEVSHDPLPDPVDTLHDRTVQGGPAVPDEDEEAKPDEARLIVLQPTPPGPSAEMMEVVIDGVCRVRVSAGFDMEAAARLIRAVSSAGAEATAAE